MQTCSDYHCRHAALLIAEMIADMKRFKGWSHFYVFSKMPYMWGVLLCFPHRLYVLAFTGRGLCVGTSGAFHHRPMGSVESYGRLYRVRGLGYYVRGHHAGLSMPCRPYGAHICVTRYSSGLYDFRVDFFSPATIEHYLNPELSHTPRSNRSMQSESLYPDKEW